jgi:hypothetical protein
MAPLLGIFTGKVSDPAPNKQAMASRTLWFNGTKSRWMYFEDGPRFQPTMPVTVLPQRFARFGLALHPDKTRLVPYRRPREDDKGGGPGGFDFLGITHHWGRSRRGVWIPKRKTARDRLTRAVRRIDEWCRRHLHLPVKEQAAALTTKLVGHYWAYGITGNSVSLKRFRKAVRWIWHKWLARRSQRGMTWSRFEEVERAHPLPSPIAYRSKLRLAANPCL